MFNRRGTYKSQHELQESNHPDAFCSVTISCYNKFLRYFQNVSAFYTVLSLCVVPYQFFFQPFPLLARQTSSDIIYLLIILFRTRTSVMVDGVEERNLMVVRSNYQSSFPFFTDIISYLPIIQERLSSGQINEDLYSILRLITIFRLHYVMYYLELREKESGSSTLLYRTIKYVFLSLLTIHIAACIWYGLACQSILVGLPTLDLCDLQSWVQFPPDATFNKITTATNKSYIEIDSEVHFLRNAYMTSFYWACATVTSTGYGDIHARNLSEKVCSIVTMVIGISILYGMTMGGMTSMLTNIDARRSDFVHRYQAFQKEVNRMGVSSEVKTLCLKYFDYIWRRWEGEDVYSSGFLDILPECLRAQFAEARFDKFLHQADLLDETEDAFFRNLALVSRPLIYLENQFVQKSGEITDTMCYVHHGIVEVLDTDEEGVIALMHAGKLFGQAMLVFDLPRVNSIKCRTNCDIFALSKEDFRNVASLYPESDIALITADQSMIKKTVSRLTAATFLESAKLKCMPPNRVWPMEPPSHKDFHRCLQKTTAVRDRMKNFSVFGDKSLKEPAVPNLRARRMTTVYSTEYSGMDLSRVPFGQDDRGDPRHSVKPNTLNYLLYGDVGRPRHQSVVIRDGTELWATSKNYEIVNKAAGFDAAFGESDFSSWGRRLFNLTVIKPKGRVYNWWLNVLFINSILAGLYPTFIAFFTTTPGEQKLYSNSGDDDLFGRDIIFMATDSCNETQNEIYYQCTPWPFNDTAECLREKEGPFAWRVSGNQSGGYQVRLPSRYDISRVAYNSDTHESQIHFLISVIAIDVPFYLNILINFRTGVLTPNGFLTSFKDIAANYNKWNRFWLDLFGILPFEILAPFFGCSRIISYHAIAFLRLNRVLNFFRYVPSAFTRWEYSLNVKIVRIRTIKFLVYIYSITHLCACMFYWSACGYFTQRAVDNIKTKCRFGSWAWVFDISYLSDHYEDYVMTMYWASTTMTSTGYGDLTPTTSTGRFLAMVIMLIGTVMYGWLVAVIASTVSNSEAAKVEFTNSMLDTKNYLAVNLVQDSLIDRVMNVRRIEWERYAGTAIPGKQTIGKELSELLHNVLFFESLNKFVDCLPFFHGVDPAFVAMLCNYIHIYHYAEGDMVIYEGDLSRDLYVIKQGHCIVVSEDLETQLDRLGPGDYFGECETLFGCGSPRTVVAETACELLVLQREAIDEVLASFPLIQVQMNKIKRDDDYRQRILEAIAARNAAFKSDENSMTARYKTEFVEGGIKMYTERRHRESAGIFREEDTSLKLSWVQQMASTFLLPVGFDPADMSYLIYETIRTVLTLITVIIVPLQFSFIPSNFMLMFLQYTLDGFGIIDQYVKAHTSFCNDQAILVSHPTKTAVHYLRTSFFVDFLSWYPFEMILFLRLGGTMSEQQWRLMALLRFTRMLQMYKVFAYFSYWLSGIHELNRWLKIFRDMLYGLLLHHWLACLLFLTACRPTLRNYDIAFFLQPDMIILNATGAPSYTHNGSWVGKIIVGGDFPALDLVDSVTDQYRISFYWSTATLVCVGYGDIHARQPLEMMISIFVMICGTVFYSYILGGMSASVQTDDMRRGHYKDRLSDILKFFSVYDVSKETQQQVLNYYCYLWDRTGGVSPEKLFTGLPPSIRTSVCQSMYGPMIREAFDLGNYVDKETQGFFRLLSTRIKPALYLKHAIICRRNDIGNEMFFIQRGSIAILDDDETTTIKVLGPGQHFGEVALLYSVPRSKTVKASTNSELNVLTKHDLDDILTAFPQFRKRLAAIAQDRKVPGGTGQTFEHHASELALQLGMFTAQDEEVAITKPVEKEKKFFQSRVIDRESWFSFFWDNITVLLSFFSSSLSIYQASFYSHGYGLYLLGYLMDLWFAIDMFLGYHTSFLDQFSTNVDTLKTVNLHYAKSLGHFCLDVIANSPIEVLGVFFTGYTSLQLSVFSFARLNRMLRMHRLWKIFNRWEKDIRNNALLIRLYQSFLCVSFTMNLVGSVWYYMACPGGRCRALTWTTSDSVDYGPNNIHSYNLLPWVDSLYWAVATMTSTGYGDIKPLTRTEMLYACFVMVLGKIMIGYVLGMVAATLANDESLRVWYEENVSAVKNCMTDHKFDKKLFNHVVQYYEYVWLKNKGVNVTTLFPDLSFSLRADIYSQICGEVITNMELFEGCPENFIRHLSMVMAPIAYMPGDYICLQGDVRSEMYVIFSGVAEVLEHVGRDKVHVRSILEGEDFLCESVLCKHRRPYSLRATTYVDAFCMTMEGLQSVLQYYSEVNDMVYEKGRAMFPHLDL